jgi:hypothetical protein
MAAFRAIACGISISVCAIIIILFSNYIYLPYILKKSFVFKDAERIASDCDLKDSKTRSELSWFLQSPRNHPSVGFINSPNSKWIIGGVPFFINFEGARVVSEDYMNISVKDARLYVYGDSFAGSDEVHAQQSWAYQVDKNVANFGIFGGAPDQAIQFLKSHLLSGSRPRAVIIEMIPENTNRMAVSYYCTYHSHLYFGNFTKTRITSSGNFLPPPRTIDQVAEQLNNDIYFQRYEIIRKMLDNGNIFYRIFAAAFYNTLIFRPYNYLLYSADTQKRLSIILSEFSLAAIEFGFEPYFLILPAEEKELDQYSETTNVSRLVKFVAEQAAGRGIKLLNGFEIFSKWEGGYKGRYNNMPRHHLTPEANEYLANSISSLLKGR